MNDNSNWPPINLRAEVKADASNAVDELGNAINSVNSGGCKVGLGVEKLIRACIPEKLWQRMNRRQIESAVSSLISKNPQIDLSSHDYLASYLQLDSFAKYERLIQTLNLSKEKLNNLHDSEISQNELDKDWFNRWKQEAELIENNKMREMWAKTIVEKVKNPSSTSIRTLNTLRLLSAEEMNLFSKLLTNTLAGNIFFSQKESGEVVFPNLHGKTSADYHTLTGCGLVDFSTLTTFGLPTRTQIKNIDSKNILYYHNIFNKYVVCSPLSFKVNVVPFETAGREIANILFNDNSFFSLKCASEIVKTIVYVNRHYEVNYKICEIIQNNEDGSLSFNENQCLWESSGNIDM